MRRHARQPRRRGPPQSALVTRSESRRKSSGRCAGPPTSCGGRRRNRRVAVSVSPVEAAFRRLTLGVYVVGVGGDGRADAFTAAWIIQASFDPLLLALSINRQHASYPLLL